MMIWPPSVPSAGAYLVLVRSTPPSEALGATEAGAEAEMVGAEADVDGDGDAAVPHAASTIIVLPSKPTRRFRIKTPPTECVSPHCRSQIATFGCRCVDSSPGRRARLPMWSTEGVRGHTVSVRLLRYGNYGHPAHTCQLGSIGRSIGATALTSFRSGRMPSGPF